MADTSLIAVELFCVCLLVVYHVTLVSEFAAEVLHEGEFSSDGRSRNKSRRGLVPSTMSNLGQKAAMRLSI